MSFEHDDDLLAALGRAVGPDPDVRPSEAERAEFRRVVLRAAAGETGDRSTDGPVASVVPISSARRLRTRLLVGGAAVVVGLSGATAVAAAVNDGALPSPVRVVVHAVGLPVDSVEVAQAKDALKRLRTATDAELRGALTRAERDLADLTPGERTALGDDVDRTLTEARERLGRIEVDAPATSTTPVDPPTTAPAAVGTKPPSAPSSQPSTGTSTATSVDDRDDRDDSSPDSSDDRARDDSGGDDSGGGDGAGGGSDSSTATSDDRGRGGGEATAPTSPGDTTATTDDSGRGRGGDSTAATDDSGSNRGGGSDD